MQVVWQVGPQAHVTFVQYPIVAPALILVGAFMLSAMRHVAWEDPTEAIPAFLTLVLIPVTFSITDGIAFGFISHVALKGLTGRAREVHWMVAAFAVLFLLRYAVLTG